MAIATVECKRAKDATRGEIDAKGRSVQEMGDLNHVVLIPSDARHLRHRRDMSAQDADDTAANDPVV